MKLAIVIWLCAIAGAFLVGFSYVHPDGIVQTEEIVIPERTYYTTTTWSDHFRIKCNGDTTGATAGNPHTTKCCAMRPCSEHLLDGSSKVCNTNYNLLQAGPTEPICPPVSGATKDQKFTIIPEIKINFIESSGMFGETQKRLEYHVKKPSDLKGEKFSEMTPNKDMDKEWKDLCHNGHPGNLRNGKRLDDASYLKTHVTAWYLKASMSEADKTAAKAAMKGKGKCAETWIIGDRYLVCLTLETREEARKVSNLFGMAKKKDGYWPADDTVTMHSLVKAFVESGYADGDNADPDDDTALTADSWLACLREAGEATASASTCAIQSNNGFSSGTHCDDCPAVTMKVDAMTMSGNSGQKKITFTKATQPFRAGDRIYLSGCTTDANNPAASFLERAEGHRITEIGLTTFVILQTDNLANTISGSQTCNVKMKTGSIIHEIPDLGWVSTAGTLKGVYSNGEATDTSEGSQSTTFVGATKFPGSHVSHHVNTRLLGPKKVPLGDVCMIAAYVKKAEADHNSGSAYTYVQKSVVMDPTPTAGAEGSGIAWTRLGTDDQKRKGLEDYMHKIDKHESAIFKAAMLLQWDRGDLALQREIKENMDSLHSYGASNINIGSCKDYENENVPLLDFVGAYSHWTPSGVTTPHDNSVDLYNDPYTFKKDDAYHVGTLPDHPLIYGVRFKKAMGLVQNTPHNSQTHQNRCKHSCRIGRYSMVPLIISLMLTIGSLTVIGIVGDGKSEGSIKAVYIIVMLCIVSWFTISWVVFGTVAHDFTAQRHCTFTHMQDLMPDEYGKPLLNEGNLARFWYEVIDQDVKHTKEKLGSSAILMMINCIVATLAVAVGIFEGCQDMDSKGGSRYSQVGKDFSFFT